MKLININSKRGIVNLLSDYILNKIDKKYDTIIQVTDFNHFFCINGITQSTEILDLSKIKDEFISEYNSLIKSLGYSDNISILDMMKYDKDFKESKNNYQWTTVYNSSRPLYNQDLLNTISSNKDLDFYSINDDDGIVYEIDLDDLSKNVFIKRPLQVSSEFPYGYSLSMGRGMMYYSELIGKKILPSIYSDKIKIQLSDEKNYDGDTIIELITDSIISKEKIKSLILDVFDFDYNQFYTQFKSYDFCDDIKKPTEDKFWLVKDIEIKDLVIL